MLVHSRIALILAAPLLSGTVYANSVSYFLDQSNEAALPDGTNYLTVTIDDMGGTGASGDDIITFTVATVGGAFNPGTNFGIQTFGFNIADSTSLPDSPNASWGLPSGWSANVAPPPNQLDGFGRFDVEVTDGGSSRQDPLVFTIDVAGDSIASYVDLSGNPGNSQNPPAQGNQFFAAHVAGFTVDGSSVTSAWFGGQTLVPIPAAVWLFGSGMLGLAAVARRKRLS